MNNNNEWVLPYGKLNEEEEQKYAVVLERMVSCSSSYLESLDKSLSVFFTGTEADKRKFIDSCKINSHRLSIVVMRYLNDRKKYYVLHRIKKEDASGRIARRKVAASLVQWVYLEKPISYPEHSLLKQFMESASLLYKNVHSESDKKYITYSIKSVGNPSLGLIIVVLQYLYTNSDELVINKFSNEIESIMYALQTGTYTQQLAESVFYRIYGDECINN